MLHEKSIFGYYEKEIRRFRKVSPDELRDMVTRHQAGDPKALEEIFRATCKLGSKCAHQFRYTNVPIEDLIQVANEGLLRAASKWTPQWSAIGIFFAYEAHNAIRAFIAKQAYTVNVPYSITRPVKANIAAIAFAEKQGVPYLADEVYHVYCNYGVTSFDGFDFDIADEQEEPTSVRAMIKKLPAIQKQVVLMNYYGEKGKREIKAVLNLSKTEYEAQLALALNNLKNLLKNHKYQPIGLEIEHKQGKSVNSVVQSCLSPRGINSELYQSRWMWKLDERKQVRKPEIQRHLDDGWQFGQNSQKNVGYDFQVKGSKWMRKGKNEERVAAAAVEKYLKDGWELGRLPNQWPWINNGKQSKQVSIAELKTYLKNGWKKGRIRTWINQYGK